MEYCQDISYKTFSTNNGFVGSQAYTYGGYQPHAVTGVTSAEGNIAPSQCQVTYNKFNRPASISEGDYTLSLTCQSSPTLDLAILKKNGTAVCSTLYISRISECEKTAYTTRYIDYIYAGGIPVAIHVKNNFLQTDSIYYVQTDLLGSWERIVDANKQVVQASHFDPWGNRMKATQWHVADTARSFPFHRGFTGHEHYDRFRIINTGARLYDPVTARFFSPDPYVQDPFSTQSFNRYSYCWNNPVMYTDPTGEFIFIYSWIVGFIHGFFSTSKDRLKTAWNTGWRLMQNDFQLYKGMIASDPNKSTGERLWEIISRNTYQWIQTSLGFGLAQIANLSEGFGITNGGISKIDFAYGATVVTFNVGKNWGITLGSYISGGKELRADPNNNIFQHEYGHYLQSQEKGLTYLFLDGIPSAINAATHSSKEHDRFYVELDANRRAFSYFNRHVKNFYKSRDEFENELKNNIQPIFGWDFVNNPLYDEEDVYHDYYTEDF